MNLFLTTEKYSNEKNLKTKKKQFTQNTINDNIRIEYNKFKIPTHTLNNSYIQSGLLYCIYTYKHSVSK